MLPTTYSTTSTDNLYHDDNVHFDLWLRFRQPCCVLLYFSFQSLLMRTFSDDTTTALIAGKSTGPLCFWCSFETSYHLLPFGNPNHCSQKSSFTKKMHQLKDYCSSLHWSGELRSLRKTAAVRWTTLLRCWSTIINSERPWLNV